MAYRHLSFQNHCKIVSLLSKIDVKFVGKQVHVLFCYA